MNSIHIKTAHRAINEYLDYNSTQKIESEKIPLLLLKKESCFVTLKLPGNKLRGCIGTLEPVYENLFKEIIKNAVSSAFRDYRFTPLTKSEFLEVKISVEVLSPLEKIDNIELLNPEIYGAVISDKFGRRGVLLPGIEGIDTVEDQIRIIKKKAGITQESNFGLDFFRFKTEKFT